MFDIAFWNGACDDMFGNRVGSFPASFVRGAMFVQGDDLKGSRAISVKNLGGQKWHEWMSAKQLVGALLVDIDLNRHVCIVLLPSGQLAEVIAVDMQSNIFTFIPP